MRWGDAVGLMRTLALVEGVVVDNTVVVDWKSCKESCRCKRLTIHGADVVFEEGC